MNRSKNSRGLEMGISAVIVIAIALMVLLTVALFFFGGFGGAASKIKDVSSGATDTAGGLNTSLKIKNASVYGVGVLGPQDFADKTIYKPALENIDL